MDAGHVLAAQDAGEARSLRFILATQPTRTQTAAVDQIARWTELDEDGEPGVRVTARMDASQLPEARPGATAVAKVFCGRGRLGYVWFGDLIELLRSTLFF